MSAFSLSDLVCLGSGLSLFALFASAHPGATLWRARLAFALALAGLAVFAALALFYRPASWGPLLADIIAGDWTDWAKATLASLAGVVSGRILRRALDQRARRRLAPPPSPPPTEPARPAAPAPAPAAGVWNKTPPLRHPGAARANGPLPDADSPAATTVSPPPPSLWSRWRRRRAKAPTPAPVLPRSPSPPGVSPTGRPWAGTLALACASASALLAFGQVEARAQPRPSAPSARNEAQRAPARPDPETMRRAMLRTLVQSNQIVFDREGDGFVPRCRCGPKLAPADMPKMLIDALVATEDKRFWDHYGVDPIGMARGMFRALMRRRAEGGSTITQQLVKNAILTSERSLNRKRQEAQLALAVESAMSKTEIVAAYLNQISFGAAQGREIVGVRAAALHFFGREPGELNLGEAAGLVGLLNAPTRNSPNLHPDHFESRRQLVVTLAEQSGKFTKARIAAARKPLRPRGPRKLDWPETRWFVEIAMAELKNRIPDFTPTASTRVATSFVADRQNALEIGLARGLARLSGALPETGLQTAIVALGHDGRLLGALGGRDYAQSQFNRALSMARPAASTAKIFVFSAAFDAGRTPANALIDAFATSDNATAEELAREIGVEPIARMARRHGVVSPYAIRDPRNVALGANSVGAIELTGAMLPYVNNGLAVRAHSTFGVWRDGEPVHWRDPAQSAMALSRRVTAQMRPLLRAVVTRGTASGHVRAALQAAGKTGTSDDNRDGWFVGYTPRHVIGVWLGRDDDQPVPGLTGGATSEVFDAVAAQLAAQTN